MQNQIEVRPAQPRDARKLIEFNLWMASETENKQLDPAVLTLGVNKVLQDASLGFYLVADVEGEMSGCLMVTTEWSDWRNAAFWWIQSVYVVPEFRRKGVFRALYEAAREQARGADQVCGCRLYVERDNAAAQATYTRLGFTETNYRMFEELFQ